MRDVYLAKAAADPTNDPAAAEAIRDHFNQMNATLRALEKERAEAEPRQLEALQQFAQRAYRRPLTPAERANLLAYYHQDRAQNQLSHEDALRGAITGVLMEPDFLYRLDMTRAAATAAATKPRPENLDRRPSRAALQLRPGQPPELLPLGQHARRGIVTPRRIERPAKTRSPPRPNPPHAEGRPRPRPGHGVHRQLAQLPSL